MARGDDIINASLASSLAGGRGSKNSPIEPTATKEIVYLTADEEDRYAIAQASTPLDDTGRFLRNRVSVRRHQTFELEDPQRVQYMDVAPQQIVSVSTALIPFLEHDDANRALMGSNMQRQAVPLIQPEAPVVGTGMEYAAAVDSGHVLLALKPGRVISASSLAIVIEEEDSYQHTYELRKYNRSNQSTCINQRPVVFKGDYVEENQVLADSSLHRRR